MGLSVVVVPGVTIERLLDALLGRLDLDNVDIGAVLQFLALFEPIAEPFITRALACAMCFVNPIEFHGSIVRWRSRQLRLRAPPP